MARNAHNTSSPCGAARTATATLPEPWPPRPLAAAASLTCALLLASAAAAPQGAAPAGAAQAPAAPAAATEGSAEDPTPPMQPHRQGEPAPHDVVPRWLEAVRAQRRALQERRRAQHQARRRALDPMGTARQEALEQELQRRRREMRDMIAQDRWLFLNFGPWLAPMPSPPVGNAPAGGPTDPPGEPPADPTGQTQEHTEPVPRQMDELPEWDNGWYFRGW